jgi:hypothetical protein
VFRIFLKVHSHNRCMRGNLHICVNTIYQSYTYKVSLYIYRNIYLRSIFKLFVLESHRNEMNAINHSDQYYHTLKTIFHWWIPKQIWPSLTPKYQLNIWKQNYDIMSEITIFCREVYSTRNSHTAVSIGNNIFPKGIMKLQ